MLSYNNNIQQTQYPQQLLIQQPLSPQSQQQQQVKSAPVTQLSLSGFMGTGGGGGASLMCPLVTSSSQQQQPILLAPPPTPASTPSTMSYTNTTTPQQLLAPLFSYSSSIPLNQAVASNSNSTPFQQPSTPIKSIYNFMANSVGGGSTSPTSPSSSSSSSPSSPPLIVLISEKQFQIQQQQKQQQQQQLASLSSPPLSPTNKQYSAATPTTPTMPPIVEQQVFITSDVRPQVVPLSLSVSISMPSSNSLASMSFVSSSPPSLRSNLVMSQENLLNANGGGSSNGSTNSSNEASKQQQQQQQQQQQYQQQPVQNYPTIAQTTNSSSINIKLVETNDQPQLLQQQSQQQQQPVVEDTNHVSATNTTANTTTQPTTIVTTVNENEISNTAVVGATKEEEKEKAVEEEEAAEDEDEDDDDEEAENAVVEESGDGRWSKRKEAVSQRDIPGIDCAYLAMDTEYGVEVVWNEIKLSRGKKFKNENLHSDEKAIDSVFKNLINLNHPNIVRFHDYWIDKRENDPRIIFITEYMSSGSLKQFLRKAKKTNQPIKKATWKRWCIQLLCALNYLHTCEPPVGHGNLSCDTIFIQHNGLIKIGCIAPDKVNTHVKTCRRDDMKWSRNLHFIAPELHTGDVANMKTLKTSQMTNNNTAVDIYAFGMVALEIFNLEFGGNGDTHPVTSELIKQAIEALDEKQRDFVTRCLETDPQKRPTIKELLFHPLLFEVPSLKLIASHQLIKTQNESRETTFNDSKFTRPPECVVASVPSHPITRDYLFSKVPTFDVNKYLEDVKNGIYPLIAYGLISGPNSATMMNASNSSSNVAALQAAVQSPSSAGGQQKRLNSTSSLRQLQQSAAQIVTGVETSKQQTITNTSPVQVTNTNTTPYIVDNIVPSAIVNLPLSGQVSTTISAASSQTTSPTQSLSQINLHPVPINLPTQQQQQQQQQQSTTPTQQPATPQQTSRTQSPIHITTNGATTSNTILNSDYTSTLNQQQQQLPVQQQQQLIMMNGDYINNNNNNTTSNNNNVNYVMDSNMSTATTTAMVIDPSILVTSNQLEKRHAQNIDINLTLDEKLMNYMLTLTITFEDRTARLIQSLLHKTDTVFNLADELVSHGLVNELDKDQLCYLLSQALNRVEQSNTILSK